MHEAQKERPAVVNSMQQSLLAGAFGEPVSKSEANKISGQRAQVETIMADGFWRTLPALQKELRRRFGTLYAETSISARLRGLRGMGYTVESRRTRPGSGLYEYRAIAGAIDPRPLTAKQRAIVAQHLTETQRDEQAEQERAQCAIYSQEVAL